MVLWAFAVRLLGQGATKRQERLLLVWFMMLCGFQMVQQAIRGSGGWTDLKASDLS